jgi:hypothetical protein
MLGRYNCSEFLGAMLTTWSSNRKGTWTGKQLGIQDEAVAKRKIAKSFLSTRGLYAEA